MGRTLWQEWSVRKHVVTSTLSGDLSVAGGIDTVRSLFLGSAIDESVPTTRLSLLRAQQTAAGNAVVTCSLRPTEHVG